MEENLGNVVHITDESQLPSGKLISSAKDDLEISEKYRKELVVWDVST